VGRGVIIIVHKAGNGFVGEHDSLITKCPSKYQANAATDQHAQLPGLGTTVTRPAAIRPSR
jgi:hypothetical protein